MTEPLTRGQLQKLIVEVRCTEDTGNYGSASDTILAEYAALIAERDALLEEVANLSELVREECESHNKFIREIENLVKQQKAEAWREAATRLTRVVYGGETMTILSDLAADFRQQAKALEARGRRDDESVYYNPDHVR